MHPACIRAVYTDGILFELIQVSETSKILAEKQSSSKEDRGPISVASVQCLPCIAARTCLCLMMSFFARASQHAQKPSLHS